MEPTLDQQANQSVLEEAKNLLVQGKRFMAIEDFQSATDNLEQACQMFDAYYGVAKRECADAYLEYGLALVALANLEAGSGTEKLMKKAGIEGGDEEEEEEEEQDDDEEGDEEEEEDGEGENEDGEEEGEEKEQKKEDAKMSSEAEEASNRNGELSAEPSSISNEQKEKTNGVNRSQTNPEPQTLSSSSSATAAASSSKEQTEPTPGTSNGATGSHDKDDESVDNEEATTIEIAWEVLCLAKRLFMTDESLEGRLKLAETLHKIGEISIEWENNDNAVSILEECLKIRMAILQPDDRLIASTYYHLGLAHSFKSDTQSANENFQNAINVIQKRVASLTKDLEKANASQDTVAIGAYQKEINELKELLPDLTMRLDDSKEDGTKSTEALKRTREEMQLEDEEARKVCLDTTKPVDDITHLVKRKAA